MRETPPTHAPHTGALLVLLKHVRQVVRLAIVTVQIQTQTSIRHPERWETCTRASRRCDRSVHAPLSAPRSVPLDEHTTPTPTDWHTARLAHGARVLRPMPEFSYRSTPCLQRPKCPAVDRSRQQVGRPGDTDTAASLTFVTTSSAKRSLAPPPGT